MEPLEERIDMDEKMKKLIEEILWKLDTALEYYITEMEAKEAYGHLHVKKLSEEEIAENNEWRLMEEETIHFDYESDWEWRTKNE
ncbi:MAG: hypothetical protein QF707_02235 [Candidatus Poseidoniaceae archaeon]|nr:hypothetical protein [Candidatus Poseidoniaceae archaeon]MDP7312044.1 hypothetical protein [Candidatus Thalassarchaeaceae archaeon]